MGQVGKYLRRAINGYSHWCPGCKEMHVIPDSWTFNGNFELPTFHPSVKITGIQIEKDEQGNWTGEWTKDAVTGNYIDECCHYNLENGLLVYDTDCTHYLRSTIIPLPELPEEYKD